MRFEFNTQQDTVGQISNLIAELKLNRFQKQFMMSVMAWGMDHTITSKQKAAIEKMVNKASSKSRCEDAPCCGCCK